MGRTVDVRDATYAYSNGTDPGARTSLIAAAGGTLLVLIAFTTVITTVPATAAAFGAGVTWQTWALSGMSLGLAVTLLPAGSLGDRLGHRRVFLASLLALAVTSVLAALPPSMLVFVAARVAQGMAGGGVLVAGLALIGNAFPAGSARTRATGMWGAMLGAGIAIGPLMAAGFGWRAAHATTALLALAVAAVATRVPRVSTGDTSRRRLDPAGAVAMAAAMGGLTAGLTAGRSSWTAPPTLALLVVGIAALAVFVGIELRNPQPMLDPALFRRPLFMVSLGGAGVTGLATVALMSYAPTLIEEGLQLGAVNAGGILAIWSVTSVLVAVSADRLPTRWSARHRLVAGLLASAAGALALAWLDPGSSWWALAPGLLVSGVGSGLANAALARVAVESVPAGHAGLGSGANTTARYLGSALGIAIVVAIATSRGHTPAALLDGWNLAALVVAGLNLGGAVLAAAVRHRWARRYFTSN